MAAQVVPGAPTLHVSGGLQRAALHTLAQISQGTAQVPQPAVGLSAQRQQPGVGWADAQGIIEIRQRRATVAAADVQFSAHAQRPVVVGIDAERAVEVRQCGVNLPH